MYDKHVETLQATVYYTYTVLYIEKLGILMH